MLEKELKIKSTVSKTEKSVITNQFFEMNKTDLHITKNDSSSEKEAINILAKKNSFKENINTTNSINQFENRNQFNEGLQLVKETITQTGQKLDKEIQKKWESKLHVNLKNVEIHTDSKANKSAEKINAAAYSVGNKIVFGQNKYNPKTSEGKKLIMHELVHVIQHKKSNKNNIVQRQSLTQGIINKVDPVSELIDAEFIVAGSILGRMLTWNEISNQLWPVFGPYLSYGKIRIIESNVVSPDGVPRTFGFNILAPGAGIGGHLVHECAHVWQHEWGHRWMYIPDALAANFAAWLITGDRNKAYDWQMYQKAGAPWCIWNAEAQAQYISSNGKLPPAYVWMTGGLLPVP